MPSLGDFVRTVWTYLDYIFHNLLWAAYYLITFKPEERDERLARIETFARALWQYVYDVMGDAIDVAIDWADEFITILLNSVASIWDSITSVWSQFGAAFLDGFWTVVTWVEDKVTGVTNWVQSNYDIAKANAINAWNWITTTGANVRDWVMEKGVTIWSWISTKADTVWDWISTKADDVWDWITNFVSPVTTWVEKYINFYASLYDNYRNLLLDFLEDPGYFIAFFVADRIEWIIATAIRWYW